MKAFTHIVIQGPAVIKLMVTDDTGTLRIEVNGTPGEHVVIEIPHVDRLELDE
jgi:hypothetical protein